MRKLLFIALLLSSNMICFGQDNAPDLESTSNKGRVYAYWGWNRSWYSTSDLHLTGDNYDIKLNDMRATDRPTPFDADIYFGPSTISLPQTDARIGFFITDKIDISVGLDHMKYVLTYNQETTIDGYIDDNSGYDGIYSEDDFVNTYSFLKFEHTDGLNYINLEIHRNDDLKRFKNSKGDKEILRIKSIIGFGAGILLPKSNVKLWNKQRHDDFHLAGYGFAGNLGLDFIFLKHVFIRTEMKIGFIDMPDIRTSLDPSDRGSQHFFFGSASLHFGYTFTPFN